MSGVEALLHSMACRCPGRSRSLPVSAELRAEEHGEAYSCHWSDSDGWTACVTSPAEFDVLNRIVIQIGLPTATFDEWLAGARAVAAMANAKPFEHWRQMFLRKLAGQVRSAEAMAAERQRQLDAAVNDLRVARCQLAVAELDDLALAATANRVLDSGWSGSPEDLLASCRAVMTG